MDALPTDGSISWDPCETEGCIGIQLDGEACCLAHVSPATRAAFLYGLRPGSDLHLRGTPIDPELLTALLAALKQDERPRLGTVRFDRAQFNGDASFDQALFTGRAYFIGTRSSEDESFADARFSEDESFAHAQFRKNARFWWTQFMKGASFGSARFSTTRLFGPMVVGAFLGLGRALFTAPVVIEASTPGLSADRNSESGSGARTRTAGELVAAALRERAARAPAVAPSAPGRRILRRGNQYTALDHGDVIATARESAAKLRERAGWPA